MAKFLTITQQGFYFNVHDADKLVRDETWSIERVAAFIAVHSTLNSQSVRYIKGMTLKPVIASIMYTLQCDRATSKDLNRLTRWLVGKLCGVFEESNGRECFLGKPLADVLDVVTVMVEEYIADYEAPKNIMGQILPGKPYYTRPTKMEYDAELERAQAQEQRYWDTFNEVCSKPERARGHKILIREGSNVYTGIIVDVTPKCLYCDVKDEFGRMLQQHARFPRDSKRFIIESFS